MHSSGWPRHTPVTPRPSCPLFHFTSRGLSHSTTHDSLSHLIIKSQLASTLLRAYHSLSRFPEDTPTLDPSITLLGPQPPSEQRFISGASLLDVHSNVSLVVIHTLPNMPRPKVRPEDRQRAARACLICKASKKRCDAQLPCSNCVRRNKHSQCSYEDSDLMEPPPKRQHRMSTSNQSSEPAFTLPPQHPQSAKSDRDSATPGLLETSTMPQRLTRDRLLLSSKGEQGMLILTTECATIHH